MATNQDTSQTLIKPPPTDGELLIQLKTTWDMLYQRANPSPKEQDAAIYLYSLLLELQGDDPSETK